MDAAKVVSNRLDKYKNEDCIVMAIPRGGIPVGYQIARQLQVPLDISLLRRIGHPSNHEFTIGAVNMNDYFVTKHDNVPQDYIHHQVEKLHDQIQKEYQKITGHHTFSGVDNKTVILTDDGNAKLSTILANIRLLRKEKPKKIVLAIPVAPYRTICKLEKYVDELICPIKPDEVGKVDKYYQQFELVSDDEIVKFLAFS